jgi:hypothetical protein
MNEKDMKTMEEMFEDLGIGIYDVPTWIYRLVETLVEAGWKKEKG